MIDSLEHDPNMQLSCAAEAAAAQEAHGGIADYPTRPILHDRGEIIQTHN